MLVIRGELLKRYPTAVIYAHRACWQRTDDGTAADRAKDPCSRSGGIDNSKERRLAPLTAAEQGAPPRSKVLTPLFEARIDPDIYFLGFDLTVGERARQPQASTPTTTRAGSSSSRSGPGSRDSASTLKRRPR